MQGITLIIVYMAITLFATTIGATTGLGGGVIIKPFFDMLNFHSSAEIGFFSSSCVLLMTIVSISKQMKNRDGIAFDVKTALFISAGSVAGGVLGENVFSSFLRYANNNATVKTVQNAVLLVMLVIICAYTLNKHRIRALNKRGRVIEVLTGFVLGAVSVFLGIGGGPLNIAVLTFVFGFEMKAAVIYSIVTIFFSQVSKLSILLINGTFFTYDLMICLSLLPAAAVGGFIGSAINRRLTGKQIEQVYLILMAGLIVICITNLFSQTS